MEDIVNVIMNNGIGVACILYFMHFNSTTLKAVTDTMNEVKQSLILLNDKINDMEKTIKMEK